jgi:hypothetical protein
MAGLLVVGWLGDTWGEAGKVTGERKAPELGRAGHDVRGTGRQSGTSGTAASAGTLRPTRKANLQASQQSTSQGVDGASDSTHPLLVHSMLTLHGHHGCTAPTS